MRLIATLIVLLAPVMLTQPAHAQEPVPDTTSAWRYFPLEVGNTWEYQSDGSVGSPASDHRIAVEADTVIEGRQYFVVTHDGIACSPCLDRFTVRFDAEAGTLLQRSSDGDEVAWWYSPCPLGAGFADQTACGQVSGGYAESFELADGSVLDGITYKRFDAGFEARGYVADVGFVTHAILQGEPGEVRLRYARVGGVEYGEPFPVDVEEGPSPPAPFSLSVHPNPLRVGGTVEFVTEGVHRVHLAVHDVLGRRVALLHEGPLPSGDHRFSFDASALSAGTYFVRATSTGATVTSTFTIAR